MTESTCFLSLMLAIPVAEIKVKLCPRSPYEGVLRGQKRYLYSRTCSISAQIFSSPSFDRAENGFRAAFSTPSSFAMRVSCFSRSFLETLSHLVTTSMGGMLKVLSQFSSCRSSSLGILRISMMRTTPRRLVRIERYFSIIGPHCRFTSSGTLANPYPGRSTSVKVPFTSKKFINWVRPGVELVLTRFLRFTRALIRDDFPTFDLPEKAISGRSPSGYC